LKLKYAASKILRQTNEVVTTSTAIYVLRPLMTSEINSSLCVHQRTLKEKDFYEDEVKHKF
jgi:hypothetical protein